MRQFMPILAAAGFAVSATHAVAEPFTLLIYEAPAQLALRGDTGAEGQTYWKAYGDFARQAQDAGILRGGAALHDGLQATTLQSGTRREAVFGTSPLPLSGYFQIDVADRQAALDWAARLPAAATGAVEIRQGYPAPGM